MILQEKLFAGLAALVVFGTVATITALSLETWVNRAATVTATEVIRSNEEKLKALKIVQDQHTAEVKMMQANVETILTEITRASVAGKKKGA